MKAIINIVLVLLSPILLAAVIFPEFVKLLRDSDGATSVREHDSKHRVLSKFQRSHS